MSAPAQRLSPEYTLDTSGLTCPMHVLMCKAKLARMEAGDELRFVGTDRGCLLEIPLLVSYTGCELVEQGTSAGRYHFRIRRRSRRRNGSCTAAPVRRPPRRALAVALAWLTGRPRPAAGAT
ncbi:MAG: sulfurtransferase TusA family protein [Gammaproteobacteria bacterium]